MYNFPKFEKDNIRIAVTGGRDFNNYEAVIFYMNTFTEFYEGKHITIVHGCAAGLDSLVDMYCTSNLIETDEFPADWKRYETRRGKNPAGAIRNKQMADSGLDLLLSFPGGTGTANMTRICREKGIPVVYFP